MGLWSDSTVGVDGVGCVQISCGVISRFQFFRSFCFAIMLAATPYSSWCGFVFQGCALGSQTFDLSAQLRQVEERSGRFEDAVGEDSEVPPLSTARPLTCSIREGGPGCHETRAVHRLASDLRGGLFRRLVLDAAHMGNATRPRRLNRLGVKTI